MGGLSGGTWWTGGDSIGPPASGLDRWPRAGMSIAGLIVNTAHNIPETVRIYQDCGVELTRINLLSALWEGVNCLPYQKAPDGRWDLYRWNSQYFDRLAEIRDRMNAVGIVVIWTNYELYSWSQRKPGPQQTNTPWRHNVNGVYWPSDDLTFGLLPDEWSKDWIEKVTPSLHLRPNVLEIGNEFPEKPLHERTRDVIRGYQPNALVSVNRNEDTPGQYVNMKIGTNYDLISFHGRLLKELSDLDRVYPREPDYKTFRQFMDRCPHDPKRVCFSSDGARISADPVNTYDWDTLREWFREMRRRGYSTEHQSRAKMTRAPNHSMIEADWFASVVA